MTKQCLSGIFASDRWFFRDQLSSRNSDNDGDERVLEVDIFKKHVERHQRRHMTRIDIVKQLFHGLSTVTLKKTQKHSNILCLSAFINRSQAYDYPNHIGLMIFNSKTEYKCKVRVILIKFCPFC